MSVYVSYLSLWFDEVNLQEGLEVEVCDFIFVGNSKQLGKCRVWKNASLEVWIEAVVLLDISRDELGNLCL
jgi:hypothetical protein